jgi:hypothetical protein
MDYGSFPHLAAAPQWWSPSTPTPATGLFRPPMQSNWFDTLATNRVVQ